MEKLRVSEAVLEKAGNTCDDQRLGGDRMVYLPPSTWPAAGSPATAVLDCDSRSCQTAPPSGQLPSGAQWHKNIIWPASANLGIPQLLLFPDY